MYNDTSVLENFHVSEAFTLLVSEGFELFSTWKTADRDYVRNVIINMVLATDLKQHFSIKGNIEANLEANDGTFKEEDKLLMLKTIIKCADIGHALKPLHIHQQWSTHIIEEFFRQGDNERALWGKEKISPFMDGHKTDKLKDIYQVCLPVSASYAPFAAVSN